MLPFDIRVGIARYTLLAASGSGSTTCGIVMSGADPGTVYCWGRNLRAEAGAAPSLSVTDAASTPVMHDGARLSGVTRIALGPTTGCAIDGAGALWCWGDTDFDDATPGVPGATTVIVYAPL